jgi:hypothetical protein
MRRGGGDPNAERRADGGAGHTSYVGTVEGVGQI